MSDSVTIPRSEYEHLVEREVSFRHIAHGAPVLLRVADAEAQCTWFNEPWLRFRGRSLAEECGNGWMQGIHPDDVEGWLRAYRSSFETRQPFRTEYRLLRADGVYRWMLDHGAPRFAESGEFLGYIGSSVDITELRDTRLLDGELTKRLGELAAIVESSDDVILSKSLNGTITSWNAAATRVFGYTAEEMVGRSILTLIPEHLHSDETLIIENIRAGKRVEHFETVRRTKDGRLIDVSLTVSPVKDASGTVIGASKILRDVSSRKRVEQSLMQAEKIAATGRMAATIAHEINNPLEAVMNLLYLLRPAITDSMAISYLNTAENELTRVANIAKQTLGYYREHASASAISLSEIVRQAIAIYQPRCHAANIRVEAAFDSEQKVVLRRGEMMQVVSNLITNSIYAMPSGGVLTIAVSDRETRKPGVLLTVRDDGMGIPDDVLPRVFDAFFTTRSTIGTGIGLFVSRQFVEGHGGEISLRSQTGEGHGTTVEVFLPAVTTYDKPN